MTSTGTAMFPIDDVSSNLNIAVPVLVIPGDRDPVLKPEASTHIASVVADGTLVALSPAKHMGLMERHTEFNAVVGDFCATHVSVPVRGLTA
jgi:pimeloyl-ACP methyl ester carboxylesterase